MEECVQRLSRRDVVAITGNNGLLGSAIVGALGRRGDPDADGDVEVRERVPQLIGLDRDGQPQPPPYCECIVFDVTDPASVDLGLRRVAWQYGRRLAGFVHLAAYYDFSGEASPRYEQITVEGTRNVLRALRAQAFQVERFVFSSTTLVHRGGELGERVDEDSPLGPGWPYPESKLETERLLRQERGDIPLAILRIAGVYTDACDSIPLSRQIQRIYERRLKSHLYSADPRVGQAFVHLDDTVDAILAALERRDELPEEATYLIGEPGAPAYGELQDRLGELIHGRDGWKTLRVPAPVARAGAAAQDAASALPGVPEPFIRPWMIDEAGRHFALDVSAAQRDLGWSPRHRLLDTLQAMVEALRRDPEAWYRRHGLGD
jgi:nucleoside-diphosphate-sugar epimerase